MSHFGCFMHTTIPVQHVVCEIIFHTVDAFRIWKEQLGHHMELGEKLLAILLVIIFLKCGDDKCHRETDFKTLLS